MKLAMAIPVVAIVAMAVVTVNLTDAGGGGKPPPNLTPAPPSPGADLGPVYQPWDVGGPTPAPATITLPNGKTIPLPPGVEVHVLMVEGGPGVSGVGLGNSRIWWDDAGTVDKHIEPQDAAALAPVLEALGQ